MNRISTKGKFIVQHLRNGNIIGEHKFSNGVTNGGLDKLLDVMFHNVTQIGTWYIGIVDNASFVSFDAGDTMSSHINWIELTAYSESTRGEWTEGAASSKSITNASPVVFNINATKVVKGLFITSDNTKSGTTGTLWATGAFAATVSVESGDQLKVTYTITAAEA